MVESECETDLDSKRLQLMGMPSGDDRRYLDTSNS
jgi:hypothetical protein